MLLFLYFFGEIEWLLLVFYFYLQTIFYVFPWKHPQEQIVYGLMYMNSGILENLNEEGFKSHCETLTVEDAIFLSCTA